MTVPKLPSGPAASRLDARSFQRAFHRGRLLILILAVGTAIIFLQDAANEMWSHGLHGVTMKQAVGWIVAGMICWWFFRGGTFSTGCIGTMYLIVFVCFCVALIYAALNGFIPAGPPRDLPAWRDWLEPLATGGWVTFAVWVLLISKDARLYREAQRQAIRAEEADAFKRPPPGRS